MPEHDGVQDTVVRGSEAQLAGLGPCMALQHYKKEEQEGDCLLWGTSFILGRVFGIPQQHRPNAGTESMRVPAPSLAHTCTEVELHGQLRWGHRLPPCARLSGYASTRAQGLPSVG